MKQQAEEKIRILAIAPYEGMRESIIREAVNFPDIQLDALTGNLEEGVRLAQENFHSNYDIIISRGGTASLLKERVDLPVKEVPISLFDVLQAIQICEHQFQKTAVVGYRSITESASQLIELLNLDIEVFTIFASSELEAVLKQLKNDGFQTVICDVISASLAREEGFDTLLITSGSESIRRALEEAIEEMRERRALRDENAFLREILSEQNGDLVIFREDNSLYFSSLQHAKQQLMPLFTSLLDEIRNQKTSRIIRTIEGYIYTINASLAIYGEREFVTYAINRNRTGSSNRYSGIFFYTRKEIETMYRDSFFQLSGEINPIRTSLERMINSQKPLLIMGEYGSGRTGTAQYYYLNCPASKQPFIEIDCEMLNDREREFLLNHTRSPLFLTGNVVHIKNMEHNSDSFMKELLSFLVHVDFCRHNTVIFSCSPSGEVMQKHLLYLKNKFQCLEVAMEPLRYHAERIPLIINLYFSQQNALGKIGYMRMENSALDAKLLMARQLHSA